MPTAEKDAAASDQALALTNSLSIKATPIEARIIELKMKPRSPRDHTVDREAPSERRQSNFEQRFSGSSYSRFDHQKPPCRQRRNDPQRNGRRMLPRRFLKRLRHDDNADVEKDADPGFEWNQI